jgi:hypothetical protein
LDLLYILCDFISHSFTTVHLAQIKANGFDNSILQRETNISFLRK